MNYITNTKYLVEGAAAAGVTAAALAMHAATAYGVHGVAPAAAVLGVAAAAAADIDPVNGAAAASHISPWE